MRILETFFSAESSIRRKYFELPEAGDRGTKDLMISASWRSLLFRAFLWAFPAALLTALILPAEAYDLRGHYNAVDALRFTTDGEYILSHSSRGRTVILWSVRHRRVVGRLRHRDLKRAALMPRTRGMVTMGSRIRIWDGRTGAVMRSFPLPKNPELFPLMSENILTTPDEKYLVYHSYESLNFFNLRKGKPDFRIKKERAGAGGNLLFSPDGKTIFLLSDGGAKSVSVWSVAKRKRTARLKTKKRLSCFAVGGKGKIVVAGARGGSLFVWRRDSSGPPTELFLPDNRTPSHVQLDARGRFAAVSSGTGVVLFDLRTNRRKVVLARPGYLRGLSIDGHADFLAGAGNRGELFLHPLRTPRESKAAWESALKRTAARSKAR